ncbi:MAG: DNA polymerase III, subunit gamma and tau [Acidimicrobiaceae bacterium]|nr:DNA polymerase III, subunit gamma and tau [Acidimicrobiaceae bacterium]
MAYQSLYRRYRPQRFGEIRGQRHVVSALQNAIVKGEVGHAYLFHGPRGTGKTTSARVLAKALNCENLSPEGEPCGECESCVAIEQGRSFDLHELDAASNNKVEDMRDLLAKVNLGTPGRAKVYILDEVHMLTSQAENALLKTLEEPPDHVTWVLATTEPHKVVETIRSRCQVFQLTLLGADEMAEHVRWVSQDAGLDVSDEAVEHVVTAGGGSVRDTLSALDRVVAAGGVVEADTTTDTLAQAIAGRDVGAALAAVGDATGRGRDPRTIGEDVLAVLRDAFLATMGAPPPRLSPAQADRAEQLAALMSPAAMTRAMETLGVSLVEMRQAPDPRVDLEVALVRLCRPDADRSLDALSARVEQLERQLAGDAPIAAPSAAPPVPSAPEPVPTSPPTAAPAGGTGVAAAARRALAEKRGDAPPPAPPSPSVTPSAPPPVPSSPTSAPPPVPAPEPPSPSPIADAPAPATDPDASLRSLRPQSPSEVVQLAGAHLDLDRDTVVRRATEVLGPAEGTRSEDDLARLWSVLVDEVHPPAAPSPTPPPVLDDSIPSPPAADADDPGPTPPDDQPVEPASAEAPPVQAADEDVDLHDLIDAPSHTDEIIERLTEAFPGAELQTKESTEEP